MSGLFGLARWVKGMKLLDQVRGRPRVLVTLTSTAKAQIRGNIWLRGRNGQVSGTYRCQVGVGSAFRDARGGEHLCSQTPDSQEVLLLSSRQGCVPGVLPALLTTSYSFTYQHGAFIERLLHVGTALGIAVHH